MTFRLGKRVEKPSKLYTLLLAALFLILMGASFYGGYLWHDRNYRHQAGDLNHDGKVDIIDFSLFVENYKVEVKK